MVDPPPFKNLDPSLVWVTATGYSSVSNHHIPSIHLLAHPVAILFHIFPIHILITIPLFRRVLLSLNINRNKHKYDLCILFVGTFMF